jgi:hypothetical protein
MQHEACKILTTSSRTSASPHNDETDSANLRRTQIDLREISAWNCITLRKGSVTGRRPVEERSVVFGWKTSNVSC